MYVCALMGSIVPPRAVRGSPGTGDIGGCEPLCERRGSNSGLLEEQSVLLTAELFIAPAPPPPPAATILNVSQGPSRLCQYRVAMEMVVM